MENRFDRFVARDVHFVDNSSGQGPSPAELARQGLSALHERRYGDAIARLRDAVAAEPDGQMARFHLALAYLQGTRPHRQTRSVLAAVRGCAAAAPDLAEARALEALVDEDVGLAWRRRPTPAAVVSALVAAVPAASAALMIDHTMAVGAPVFEALHLRRDEASR